MKTNKKSLFNQRKLIEKKIQPWLPIRGDQPPPSGWLKAIRGALAINTRDLAERLGINHGAIQQFEKRETAGKISIESIEKIARAMNCKLIYAIVPAEPHSSFDSILDAQAIKAAREIVTQIDHSMRLEQQGLSPASLEEYTRELATQLKAEMSSRLWGNLKMTTHKKSKK